LNYYRLFYSIDFKEGFALRKAFFIFTIKSF